MDHYERLGVARDCNRDTLHKAFRDLSKAKHPDRFEEHLRRKAEKEYLEIVKAFNILKDPKQRQSYDRQLKFYEQTTPLQNQTEAASEKFKLGLQEYKRGKLDAALKFFDEACQGFENAEYFFYRGLAQKKMTGKKQDSLKSFQRAIALNPKQAKYHQFMIQTMLDLGMKSQAEKAVDRAIREFPSSKEILAYGAAVNPEKYSEGQGLLNSMFNRRKGL